MSSTNQCVLGVNWGFGVASLRRDTAGKKNDRNRRIRNEIEPEKEEGW